MSLLNRLALAACRGVQPTDYQCADVCAQCRRSASATALELADWLDERFGYSETANLIRGVMPEVA